MKGDKRIDRLLPALSAKERAILLLRDFKTEKEQDRQLLSTAPDNQAAELNRLIGMMNAANGDLAHVIVIIRERALKEELRFSWLVWARICALEMWAVRAHFCTSGKEAITESQYRQREQETRAELIPIDECAMIYTEDYHVWDAADYETNTEDGEQYPTDEAWYRVRDEKLAELRRLVAEGTLPATGRGKRRKIRCGDFYDLLGEPVPVVPDFGIAFDVQPDHREREVTRARRDQEFVQRLLDRGACKLDVPLDMESPVVMDLPPGGFGVEMARILALAIRSAVQENWRELRAIEEQVAAITEEFDGEDVLHARVRDNLEEARTTLVEVHGQLQEYTGPFELPEPDEEIRDVVQRVVDNEVNHVPTR